MASRLFKYSTVMLAVALAVLIVWCGFWHVFTFVHSGAQDAPHGYAEFPDAWRSHVWGDGLVETRYDTSYDSCAINLDNRGNGTIIVGLDCAGEHYGMADSSRSGEKHTFVTEPGAFELALPGFDGCSMYAVHTDGILVLEASQTMSIDINCRLEPPA